MKQSILSYSSQHADIAMFKATVFEWTCSNLSATEKQILRKFEQHADIIGKKLIKFFLSNSTSIGFGFTTNWKQGNSSSAVERLAEGSSISDRWRIWGICATKLQIYLFLPQSLLFSAISHNVTGLFPFSRTKYHRIKQSYIHLTEIVRKSRNEST